MAPKQKMRLANEKHSKNVTNRGNVPKSLVSHMLSLFIENEVSIHRASAVWFVHWLAIHRARQNLL